MENVLFDFQGANRLNKLVQTKIAPHLFLVCNYNPNAFMLISEDAKFIQGVANLYKFAIDSSLIKRIKRIDYELGGKINKKYRSYISSLEKDLETINYLRTFAFHNNNDNEIMDKTEAWLISVIQKKQFETANDYEKAVNTLKSLGDNLYRNVIKILEQMVKEYDHEKLVNEFQNEIVLFYKDNDRIVKDELRNVYKSVVNSRGIVNDRALANWCQKLYIGQNKDKIDYLSAFIPRSKGDQKEKLNEKISQLQSEIDKTQEQVINLFGKRGSVGNFDYLNFYCYSIEEKCNIFLLDIQKRRMTMLPQDMIQLIISEDFKSVPIM